jgi:mRNA interferase HigB
LRAWHSVVRVASWSAPQDIKEAFGTTVDFLADNRVVFDIGGNKYRLVAHIAYSHQRVLVKFVGTHREYSRIDATSIGKAP